jgi:hypothetical protein
VREFVGEAAGGLARARGFSQPQAKTIIPKKIGGKKFPNFMQQDWLTLDCFSISGLTLKRQREFRGD